MENELIKIDNKDSDNKVRTLLKEIRTSFTNALQNWDNIFSAQICLSNGQTIGDYVTQKEIYDSKIRSDHGKERYQKKRGKR